MAQASIVHRITVYDGEGEWQFRENRFDQTADSFAEVGMLKIVVCSDF